MPLTVTIVNILKSHQITPTLFSCKRTREKDFEPEDMVPDMRTH